MQTAAVDHCKDLDFQLGCQQDIHEFLLEVMGEMVQEGTHNPIQIVDERVCLDCHKVSVVAIALCIQADYQAHNYWTSELQCAVLLFQAHISPDNGNSSSILELEIPFSAGSIQDCLDAYGDACLLSADNSACVLTVFLHIPCIKSKRHQ